MRDAAPLGARALGRPSVATVNPPSPEARILTGVPPGVGAAGAVDDVERTCARHAGLREGPRALDVDIICAVVDAHLEAAATTGIDPLAITTQTRLRLVVAALLHLVHGPPPATAAALADHVTLTRWASRMARAELPTS